MSSTVHSILAVLVIALCTMALRFLPFIIFSDESKTPAALNYLGTVLPGAVMGMLVIYCYKSVSVTAYPFALPEIIATAAVALTYLWKRNTLISIALGTVLYMLLVQLVF